MNKKLPFVAVLSSLLVLNTASIAFAAPASANTVITGRTEQGNQSGVILPAVVTKQINHNVTNSVTLTGTIIIDGPQLVLTVLEPNGTEVPSSNITYVKADDKTYNYSITVNPSSFKGYVNYTLKAKTVYINGKNAGQTHTTAPVTTQTIHVSYVDHFNYTNFTWGAYDRQNNEYPYSYNLVKVWDDGKEVMQDPTIGAIPGTDSVIIQGADATYDGGIALLGTEVPPVNIRSFETQSPVWTYNEATKKYDLTFDLIKNLSNGGSETAAVATEGVAPLATCSYTAKDGRSPEFSQSFNFTAPAAPVPVGPVISDVVVSNIDSMWTGNHGNGGNVQEKYILSFYINGVFYSEDLTTNFTKNSSGLYGSQDLTYSASYNGQTIIINYTLKYVEPDSLEDNTKNN
ncbi:hypothetical protein [Candidatus Clostridium stratigraminis]|uniref:Uncharacterized protein n=1 Tax=Candidatus Clostridium stratigraminis TaxID=3381661 RepID=A0ABW8T3Q0_9CLOT